MFAVRITFMSLNRYLIYAVRVTKTTVLVCQITYVGSSASGWMRLDAGGLDAIVVVNFRGQQAGRGYCYLLLAPLPVVIFARHRQAVEAR
jgi:hypothetical protein